jgi:hypothetical protein
MADTNDTLITVWSGAMQRSGEAPCLSNWSGTETPLAEAMRTRPPGWLRLGGASTLSQLTLTPTPASEGERHEGETRHTPRLSQLARTQTGSSLGRGRQSDTRTCETPDGV